MSNPSLMHQPMGYVMANHKNGSRLSLQDMRPVDLNEELPYTLYIFHFLPQILVLLCICRAD
jgi:hypothetical protein